MLEEKLNMSIHSKIGNTLLATKRYENWVEVIITLAKKQEPAQLILKNGLRIETNVGLRALVEEIFFRKMYTPPHLPIESGDVVVDIGANNGVFTIFAASMTQNAVYAYEPFPSNFKFLEQNICANGLKNVIPFKLAVSDKIGSSKLFLNPSDGRQNLLSEYIIPNRIEDYRNYEDLTYLISGSDDLEKYVEVPTTTLQEIIESNNIEWIDFLKMDCEGSEGSIFASTPKEYLQRIRKIAMEFHDHLSVLNHNDIQKLLEEVGFTTKVEWHDKPHGSPLGFLYGWKN
jgi:FkbM family methyltransferase